MRSAKILGEVASGRWTWATEGSMIHTLLPGWRRMVMVFVLVPNKLGTPASVTYGGISMPLFQKAPYNNKPGMHPCVAVYRLMDDQLPGPGAKTVYVNLGYTSDNLGFSMICVTFSNVSQGNPVDNVAFAGVAKERVHVEIGDELIVTCGAGISYQAQSLQPNQILLYSYKSGWVGEVTYQLGADLAGGTEILQSIEIYHEYSNAIAMASFTREPAIAHAHVGFIG